MIFPIQRQAIPVKSLTLSKLREEQSCLIVWWYGGILKNYKAESVPKVVVIFRKLGKNGIPGDFVRIPIGLDYLGIVSIGTIWNRGVCISQAIQHTERINVDFSDNKWNFISPWQKLQNKESSLIDKKDYKLELQYDKNWLVDFKLDNNKNILIPSLVFFTRCYGQSSEVKRILSTYSWPEVQKRFYSPIEHSNYRNQWTVKLAKRLYDGDVILLAHIKYDSFARNAAKSVYAQIEANFSNKNKIAFVKIGPWFQSAAELMVNGLWINNKQTFLVLKITGCSDPNGKPIFLDRANSNKVASAADPEGANEAWGGTYKHNLKYYPNIIDLTDDDEPDHNPTAIEIVEPDFIVLGEPRTIIKVEKKQAESISGAAHGGDSDVDVFSTGESSGSGKDVGHASIHTRPVMESLGTLRDTWDALLHVRKSFPDQVDTVESFTFVNGYSADNDPSLISLQPFDNGIDEEIGTDIRHWPYYEIRTHLLRGILVAKIKVEDKPIYFIEIQRRPHKKKIDTDSYIDAEESFRGLVFKLNDQSEFENWLRSILSNVRYMKGVVQKLTHLCPGTAAAFNHTSAKDDKVACESAVKNALVKMGVTLLPRMGSKEPPVH